MPEKANTIRDEALRLYDCFGWFVLPTDPGGKKPYWGFTYKEHGNTLPGRETVENWPEWDRRGAGLGTRTGAVSGIVVLDVDTQEAHEFVKKSGFSPGPMVQTPREGAGYHLYFKHPGFYVKSKTYVGGVEGLDVRGDGGITVLPPSIHHGSGREYSWIIPPWDASLPNCPKWLTNLLEKESDFQDPVDVPKTMAGVPEGRRDTELNRLAGKLRYMNVAQEVAVAMIELAAENCSPPFSKPQARAKVIWTYRHYAPGEEIRPIFEPGDSSKPEEDADTFTLEMLMKEEYPPVKWVVPGLIPEGTMIFAGKPKMGKSWMALGICIAVATRGKALGEYDCEEGDVLYLALEDNKRRLQTRAKEILKGDCKGDGDLSRLSMRVRSKKLDAGLLDEIKEWLEKNPEARLVVIDTLGSVRGNSSNSRTLYEQDYEVGSAITKLANDHGVAILIIHHLRKGDADDFLDMVSGSTGLTGGMDGVIVLNRTRSAADGILKAAHRDLENDPEIALTKVEAYEGWWRFAGNAEEYRMGKERREILDVLANADKALRPMEIAEEIGKPTVNVSKLLSKMREAGYVDSKEYGKYEVGTSEVPPQLCGQSDPSGQTVPSGKGEALTTSTTLTAYGDIEVDLGNSEEEDWEF